MQAWESLYRKTIDAIELPIHVVDADLRFMFFNRKFSAWCGQFDLDIDPIGHDLFEVFPFLPPRVREEYEYVFDSRSEITTEESTFISGREIFTVTKKVPIAGERGVDGVLTIIRDITREKAAGEIPGSINSEFLRSLQESEAKYRTCIELANDAILLADIETGKIIAANPEAAELLGIPATELVGLHYSKIHPSEHAAYYRQVFQEATDRGRALNEQIYVKHRGGHLIPVEISSSVIQVKGRPVMCGIFRNLLEREHAVKKLRENEARYGLSVSVASNALEYYRALFENAHDAIMIFRPEDEVVLEVNSRACELYGFDLSEFVGMSLKDISHDVNRGEKYIEKTLANRTCPGFETIHYRKDGSKMLLEVKASVVEYNGEEVILTVLADITERRERVKRLRESDLRYGMATSAASVGVWDWDLETNDFYLDKVVKAMLGYTDDEIPNDIEIWAQYVHPEDREAVMAAAQDHLDGKTPQYVYEHRMVHKDGSVRWFMVRGNAIRDGDDKVIRMVGTDTDITDRKQAELALQSSEQWYRSIIELGASVYAVINAQGEILYESPSLERVYGWKPGELVGSNIFDNVHPLDRDSALKRFRKLLESPGQEKVTELRYLHKNGSWRDSEIRGVNLLENPVVGGIVLTSHDITDRKKLEEERRNLETQIRQVQKLESLGVLAGGIAHDFNNLLMGILGNAELLLDRVPANSTVYERVDKIALTAKRAAELTQQITTFAGKGPHIVEPLDVNHIVQEMSYLLETSASKSAVLTYNFYDDIPSIEADPTQIRQVIMNLITNASEAMSGTRCAINVTTDLVECSRDFLRSTQVDDDLPEGPYVNLEISDSGQGIDRENLDKIFDPFFSTKFTGRGLGLASTLGIVRAHKGAVKVSSTLGEGTTFSVLFPASSKPAAGATPQSEAEDGWRGHGMALVVDDEESVREVTREMLEELGFKVITAKNGSEGVALFHRYSQELSIVLLDMLMPVMNGATAFPLMTEADRSVPIIFMSGYSEQEANEIFTGEEPAEFLKKPYDQKQLSSKVRAVLDS